MRKLAAAFLALPILLPIYVPILLRRSIALRIGLALGVGGVLGFGALGIVAPRQIAAVPVSTPAPVASTAFGPVVRAGVAPNAGLDVTFSQAMDRASVAAAVTVTPAAPISLTWDAASTALTIRPASTWAPATLYSITVGAAATDATGHQLGAPTRAAFVTRAATRARIEPTAPIASGVAVSTGFTVSFDHPVDVAAAQAAFHIEPTVKGTLAAADGADAVAGFTFTPAAPLSPDVAYRVSLVGSIADLEGSLVEMPEMLSVTPVRGPTVVRFRPRNGTTDVVRSARLSVRFTAADGAQVDGGRLDGHGERHQADRHLHVGRGRHGDGVHAIEGAAGRREDRHDGRDRGALEDGHPARQGHQRPCDRWQAGQGHHHRRWRFEARHQADHATRRAARSAAAAGTRSRRTTSSS